MPIFRHGNMWTAYQEADLFVITTNSFITFDGRLVMGRGIAQEARDRFHDLDHRLGSAIKMQCGHLGRYGLLFDPMPESKIAIFQVKYHWADQAELNLIKFSTDELIKWLANNPIQVHMNFPGIGYGRCNPEDVRPQVLRLPNNVHVWQKRGAAP